MDYSDFVISPRITWSQAQHVILACEYARQDENVNDKVLKDAILSIEKEMQNLVETVIPLKSRRSKK